MNIETHENLPARIASPGRKGGWAHDLREAAKQASPKCISVPMTELPIRVTNKNACSIVHGHKKHGVFSTRIRDGRLYVQYLGPNEKGAAA